MFGSAQHIEHLWGGTKAEIRTPIWQYFLTECTYERSPGWFWLKIHFRLVELCTNHHKSRFAIVKFYYYCFFSLIGATAHPQLAVSLLLNSVSLSVWVIQPFIPFFFFFFLMMCVISLDLKSVLSLLCIGNLEWRECAFMRFWDITKDSPRVKGSCPPIVSLPLLLGLLTS